MPLLRDQPSLSSAYLVSHVDNPVQWWSWGTDAFDEARRRDVPVFLSVGYAACHWCHVMAHESFENDALAALVNEHFVPIKVDREERPDVDQLYMAATQLISGHGGWPMSVFLLPDGRPFSAGTYYPPTSRAGMVGFDRLLTTMASAWRERRPDVERQAQELDRALRREVAFVDFLAPHEAPLDLDTVRRQLSRELREATDEYGGTSTPKFPRPTYVDALFEGDADDQECAAFTLRAMASGGLYDHLDGGFARYCVDAQWHVPHFEKMLSDQALLARCYLRAARRNDADPAWRSIALATIEHARRRLRVETGYASSLDADAAGHEGSHVTWTTAEVVDALSAAGLAATAPRVIARWRLDEPGFEGRCVPRLASGEPFETPRELRPALSALQRVREQRPQPARDEKIVLETNAMLASAMLYSGDADFVGEALDLLARLEDSHFSASTWWRTEQQRAHATASDVAWWVDACVDAFEVTGEDRWLRRAHDGANYLVEHFWDGAVPTPTVPHVGHGLFTQSDQAGDLFVRPKDLFDGATPSSHATATRALARLGMCRGDESWRTVAARLVELASEVVATHPRTVADLVAAAGYVLEGVEIVVPGEGPLLDHVRSIPMRSAVVVHGVGSSPLLVNRQVGAAYVCRGGVCQRPVTTIDELDELLAKIR